MSKKYLALVVITLASATLLSGCGNNTNGNSNTANDDENNQNQAQNQAINQSVNQAANQTVDTVDPSGEYSINELMTMNKPLKCTWKESATGDSDVTNIVYINKSKFYQDVTMGDIGHSFMIYDGDYLYIWNDFNDTASKMQNTGATTNLNSSGQNSTGQEQKRDFICEKWTVNTAVFVPPSDKDFKDVTDEMNDAFQDTNLDELTQQACDSCRNAPTQELIDNCLEGLECD